MTDKPLNVLFLCAANSARSLIAEAILNADSSGRFRAYSAGSQPTGAPNPMTLNLLARRGYDLTGVRSKSWDEFAAPDAPQMDFVFAVCDNAAAETCPVWPGHPVSAHWGVPDPAAAQGSEAERAAAFNDAHRQLATRLALFTALPVETLERNSLRAKLEAIGDGASMSRFERYLTLWIALAIVAGIVLGVIAPGAMQAIAGAEIASINMVVAVLIWAMVYPMMVGVDLGAVAGVARQPRGLLITLAVNWLIKPFTMAALAVLFFDYVFAPWIAPEDAAQYIAGLILLGAAPCTAMVFVWSQLTRGDATYTLVQVSVNDVIMVFAFAPIVALLLGVTDVVVPWQTLVLATVLYIVLPLIAGVATRRALGTPEAIAAFMARIKPWSMIGLIATVVILFALQGQVILNRPVVIAMIAVPILLQSYGIFALAYGAAYALRVPHRIAAPCALIGTSNFFELAVAVAISLFGLNSGAALATVVGVLVEVPVMLSLVAFANRTRARFAG